MSNIFTHANTIDCPDCADNTNVRNPRLVVIEQNYSGSGCDMGICPNCGKAWNISYKVNEMTHVPEWDETGQGV